MASRTTTTERPAPKSFYLFGYCGKRNTGSDARLACIVQQIYELFSEDVRITVATFDPESTGNVLRRFPNVQYSRLHPFALIRLVWDISRHDVTMLVEGSTFKQNFSQALLHSFLATAWFAKLLGRRCVAYAVDVGELTPLNRFLTRKVCDSSIDLLITRTDAARDRLKKMGVQQTVLTGTDPAFEFDADPEPVSLTLPAPREKKRLGVAAIEFYHWPVRYRLYGAKSEVYQWPHYFTWNDQRRDSSEQTIDVWANLIRYAQDFHDLDISLIAMEALDDDVCRKILARLEPKYAARTELVSSKTSSPHEIVPLLRSLEYLATSRYHACVLSMKTSVPQFAVAHDERLESIYAELGFDEKFLLRPESLLSEPQRLLELLDRLIVEQDDVVKTIQRVHDEWFIPRCRVNVELLREASHGWKRAAS